MSKPKSITTKNTSAPASPATSADVLATEGAQAPSQAITQAKTGNSEQTETVLASPAGEGGDMAATPGGWPRPTHIVVTATKDGFRRGGRAWSKEPTVVPIAEFTQEQLEALATEPMLFVAVADSTDE